MEFKIYLLVFTLVLVFTQSISAPSGNDDENVLVPTKEQQILFDKLLEELKQNPSEDLINGKMKYAVDRIGGGNLI